ncbi:hypothetical protein VF08_37865, partial [Nostoc linckia z8]
MRLQGRQSAVAPFGQAGYAFGGLLARPLRHDRGLVCGCEDLAAGQAGKARAVAPVVVGNAAGGVELDGLERAHEGPAQAEPVADGLVEVLWRDDTRADEVEGLGHQHRLQAVEHEAVDLLLHGDRHLLDLLVDGAGLLHHLRVGPGCRAELDDRHEVRGVHRMGDEHARAVLEVLRPERREQEGGGGDDDGRGRGERVDLGMDGDLRLHRLRPVFLNEGAILQRLGE